MSNNFMDNANATSVVTAIGNKIKTRDKTFYGTEAQWAALSTDQKKEYDFKATPDGGSKSSMIFADVPIGTILSYGGISISKEWMLCQGQELLKADYPELYSVIADRFGTASDSSHFKLPDLRGEFLRGSGVNYHANQGNGAAVGAHQDATYLPHVMCSSGRIGWLDSNLDGDNNSARDQDKNVTRTPSGIISGQTQTITKFEVPGSTGTTSATEIGYYARPTNTSVNFIIKVKNSVDVITDINNYSTEEKVIGTWIDGKPLYQKTVNFDDFTLAIDTATYKDITGISLDKLIHLEGSFDIDLSSAIITYYVGHDYYNDADTSLAVKTSYYVTSANHSVRIRFRQHISSQGISIDNFNCTIQYTKTTD